MEEEFLNLLKENIKSILIQTKHKTVMQGVLVDTIKASQLHGSNGLIKLLSSLEKETINDTLMSINSEVLLRLKLSPQEYKNIKITTVFDYIVDLIIKSGDSASFSKLIDYSVKEKTTTFKPKIITQWGITPKTKKDEILVPSNFKPRDYQVKVLDTIDKHKYNIIVQSRQSGKDMTCFAWMVREAFKRTGNFYYVGLDNSEIRRVIWDKRMPDGTRLIDMVPAEFRKISAQSMTIDISTTGSVIQCIGLYENDNLVGTSGTYVLTEAAKQDPQAIGFLIPIVSNKDNIGGRLILNSTVRGKNHLYRTYESALINESWGHQYITAKDTNQYTDIELEEIRQWYIDNYMSDSLFKQEYMLDWGATNMGAVYSEWLSIAHAEERVGDYFYMPSRNTFVSFDIGVGDATALVVYQLIGDSIRIIDCYENTGKGVRHYVDWLRKKPYFKDIKSFMLPHDGANREWGRTDEDGNAVSRLETTNQELRNTNIGVVVLPKEKIETQINVVRNYFYRFLFNANDTVRLLNCLEDLKFKYSDKLMVNQGREPEHGWSRHMCDAVSYMCQSIALGYARSGDTISKYVKKNKKKKRTITF
jgi:hypothetical protein